MIGTQFQIYSPFIIALTVSLIIYFFSLFFGYHQFRRLSQKEIEIKVLQGVQNRHLYLPYLIFHFMFSGFLAGIGVFISNDYVIMLAVLLLGLVLAVYFWGGRREKSL
jgi:hypothetical protein